MLRTSSLLLALIASPAWVISARAQLPLPDADSRAASALFDSSSKSELKCTIEQWPPELDFAFRFVTGYFVSCPVNQFGGKKTALQIYVRVSPEGKAPVLFGTGFDIPGDPEKQRPADELKKIKNELGMSGALAMGEGKYAMEVLVVDEQNRTARKKWHLKVEPGRSQRKVALVIDPLTVKSADSSGWNLSAPQRGGIRMTLLLDAAPINSHQTKLRAWDRAFLLECIYTLLRQAPYKSVKVVAFNLEQERELFHSDSFDGEAFRRLDDKLKDTETATISANALRKRSPAEFVSALLDQELAEGHSDAIIFLGPNGRSDLEVGADLLTNKKSSSPPLFYFEYFPFPAKGFPDLIHRLVTAADGRTFEIHSPEQFSEAIHRMLVQLKQE